jgi:hypothetical protein
MTRKIDKFLELEENKEIYNFTYSYKNIMMYPIIRSLLLEEASKELYNYKYEDVIIKSFFLKIIYIIKTFIYRIPGNLKSNIIIFDTDLSIRKQENKYFNFIS